MGRRDRFATRHLVTLGAALWCWFAFWGLKKTANTYFIDFIAPWTRSSQGELNFWVGVLTFLPFSALLFGYALSPLTGRAGAAWGRWSRGLRLRPFLGLLGGLALAAVFLAWLGNRFILLGFPVTDDEHAIRFGGRCLAHGVTAARLPVPQGSLPDLFLYVRGDQVTSMDWLGGQIAWAFAELTRLGNALFGLFAALPVLLLGLHVSRRQGRAWGLAAAGLLLISPMFLTLGATTHAMVVSRALTALSLFLFFKAMDTKGRPLPWLLAGLAAGAAFITRPFEATFLLAPPVLWLVVHTIRTPRLYRAALPVMLLGAIVPLTFMLLHNAAVTGNVLLPARLAVLKKGVTLTPSQLWSRFGANLGYNVLQLVLWFLGPLGFGLVLLGVRRSRETALMAASLGSLALLALFHDDHGVHMVGPIHMADALYPLSFLAVAGLARLMPLLRRHRIAPRTTVATLVVALVIASGAFVYKYARSLRASARIHRAIYTAIREQAPPGSVLLAPQYAQVWLTTPRFSRRASWVFEWRRPRPDFSDERLILHYRAGDLYALRQAFPHRRFYRLAAVAGPPYLRLVPLP